MKFRTVLVFLAITSACSPDAPGRSCTTDGECPTGQRCVDEHCAPITDAAGMDAAMRDGGGRAGLVSIEIAPASPTVTSVNGAVATIDLEAIGHYDDGSTAPITSGFWSLDSTRLGTIDPSGTFTSDGSIAGTVQASVEAFGMTASTPITVEVSREILAEGTPSDAPTRFAGAPISDPARAANLLYPLAGTVFPENVFPADVQWEGGNEGDLYRVLLTIRGVSITAYVAHSGGAFRYDWPVDRASWRALAESAPENDVTLTVDRYDTAAGQVIAGTPRTFRFADAVIRGAIYYWDLSRGRIQRIRGDGSGLEAFMPNPPARPRDGARCVACHAVSRDGTRMAAELWDGGDFGAVFDLTLDLTGDPAPTIVPPDRQQFLSASFSPDNSRLIANNATELFLMNGETGARITPAGAPLPTTNAANPTWSPDGTAIAFVTNTDGTWGVDFRRGDLAIIDVLAPDTFAAQRTILTGAPLVIARPSWSPSSQWLAFQHSEHSRAFEDTGMGLPTIPRPGAVRMTSRDGATTYDLDALNGGARNNYYPTFSPFDEGGYFWLAFFSTRDYGNAQAGTRGTGRRQLWVAAVDSTPDAGVDPSRAAYWIPQQDVSVHNMAAFWSEEPCRADGRSCAASGECCSGFCRDQGAGPVCVPPDTVPCSEAGEACRFDADCCDPEASCLANVCTTLM